MKRSYLPVLLLIALVTGGAAAPTGTNSEATRAEVQQFIKTYVDAQNKDDATALMELVSKKSGVAIISMGEITRGWEAIRAEVDESVGSDGGLKISLGTIDVEMLAPTMALAFAPCVVTVTTEEQSFKLKGALTVVAEKSSGKWRVLHEHGSAQIESLVEAEGD